MSSTLRWTRVNQPEQATRIVPAQCCSKRAQETATPIDVYLRHARHVLTLGSAPALTSSKTLGRLLLLGLVTGVETYFRNVLSGVLRICPLATVAAGDQMISYGSVRYYRSGELEAALFENVTFSSAKEVRRVTERVVGIDVGKGSSLVAAITEFERVCHLRHASVHAHGLLTSANASVIDVPDELVPAAVDLELSGLHEVARVCHSVVRAYNQELYGLLLQRWVDRGLLSGTWGRDRHRFSRLHALFSSIEDGVGVSARDAYVPVAAAVKSRAVTA